MRHNSISRTHFGGLGGIVLVAAVGFAAVSTPALAKPAKPAGKRIAVLPPTDGTAKDAVIVAKIATVLKQHKIRAVSGGPVKKALGVGGAPSSDGAWIALARTLKVDGMLESTISGTGAKRQVEVAVHNGADGSVAGRETFAAKGPPAKLAAAVAGGLWKKLGSAIKETVPPKKDEAGAGLAAVPPSEAAPGAGKPEEAAPPAKEPEEAAPAGPAGKSEAEGKAAPLAKEKEEAEEEGEEEGGGEEAPGPDKRMTKARKRSRVPRTIEAEVGGRALRRVFQYTSTSTGTAYVMSFVPVFEGHVAWFPITYAGVFVSGEYNGALQTGSNPSFPTGTRELVIGAQGRYPVSFGLFGFSAAYFQHLFLIGDTSDPNDASRFNLVWPNVAYQGARLAASGRFYIGDMVQVGVEAAYRLVTNPGEGGPYVRSSYYFPNGMTSYGLDGSAFVGVGVMPWLEIRAGVDFRRYAFGSLQPGSDSVIKTGASGATDDYLGIYAGVVGVYGGR